MLADVSAGATASQHDAQALQESLREQAAGLRTETDNHHLDDGSVSISKVDAVQGADDWDAVKANNLPPRPDLHCDDTVQPDVSRAEQLQQLFRCRQEVARAAARRACEQPGGPGGERPFQRTSLNIGHFAVSHPGSPLTPTEPTLPIAVEPHSDFVSNDIQSLGVWEAPEVSAVLTALGAVHNRTASPPLTGGAGGPPAAPPVFLDIGANLGAYTATAAALGYEVIAFEALERNVAAIHQTLCWNPALLDRVTLFPYGLGDAERDCAVLSGAVNVGDGHLVCSEEEWAPYRGEFEVRAAVHSVRLGDYLEGQAVDVVKMDVEGYEFSVMNGAGAALDGVSVALSEVSQDMAKKSGRPFAAVAEEYLRAWAGRGFAIRFCDRAACSADSPPHDVAAAVEAATRNGESNVLFSRE